MRIVPPIFRITVMGTVLGLLPALVSAQAAPSAPGSRPIVSDAAKAMVSGNLHLADLELQQILIANPRDVHALNLMGILRAQQQRGADAERLFKQAIEIDPSFAGAYAGLGLLFVQTGRGEDAIPQLREALRLDPLRTDVRDSLLNLLRTEAREAVRAQNPEKGLAALLQARKISPDDPDVEYEFGMVALQMSLFADAIEAFQNVLKTRPKDAAALYGLGRAQIGSAKFSDAKETFARYVRDRPDDPSGQYALGLALEALQENPEARQHFEESVALRPLQTEAYFRLGLIDLDENKMESAESHFQIVLKRDPKHAAALTGLGRVAFQRKNYEEAADYLRRAVASDSSLRESHYYLGLADARLGRKDESDRELEIASRLEHEEVESHRQALKVLGLEETSAPSSHPAQ